jgi:GNAT superfamily N-acetyltransferase
MNLEKISIEPFSEEKHLRLIPELTELIHEAYKPLADMGFRYTASYQPPETTLKRLNEGQGFLVYWDERLIGTISLFGPREDNLCEYYRRDGVYYFGQFAVRPEFQGKGIARALLDFVEEKAKLMGAKELALDTAENATRLIDMYARHGFEKVSTTQWTATNYRSVVMAKKL